MISNLDFVYPENVQEYEWPAEQRRAETAHTEYYELPAQLEFQTAVRPLVLQETPAPLQFTHIKEASKPRSKSKTRSEVFPAKVKVKYSNFSNLSGKSVKKLALLKKMTKQAQVRREPKEWSDDTKTAGLFDPKLTKKLPVKVMHAVKAKRSANEPKSAKETRPNVYRDWQDLSKPEDIQTAPQPSVQSRPKPTSVRGPDNLDFRFIANQDEVVTRLEQQLIQEKSARRALDKQYAAKMQELERLKGLDKQIELAKRQYVDTQKRVTEKREPEKAIVKSAPISEKKEGLKPAVLSPIYPAVQPVTRTQLKTQIETMRESVQVEPGDVIDFPIEEVRPDLRFGNIHEEPTRDQSPPQRRSPDRVVMKPAVYHPVPAETMLSEVRSALQEDKPGVSSEMVKRLAAVRTQVQDLPQKTQGKGNLAAMATRLDLAEKYGATESIGLVSKVSAKYVAYYADDLSALLLEELLCDTVMELQRVEEVMDSFTKRQLHAEAGDMLNGLISEFQDKVKVVQGKWIEKPRPIPSTEIKEFKAPIVIEDRKRMWEIGISDLALRQMRDYKREYEEFCRRQSGGTKLWEIYARFGDQLLEETIEAAFSEFDDALGDFTQQVISQELS